MRYTGDEKAEFLLNIKRARQLADFPCLQLGERLGIPLNEKTRTMFLALLDEVESTLE